MRSSEKSIVVKLSWKHYTRTHLKNNLSAHGPAIGGIAKRFKIFKLIPLTAGLRVFTVPRLALNPNLVLEIGSNP
jgi:hypothetical protein